MISDEDLRRIAEDDHVHCGDASAMAKELRAYRKAFSEPVAWRHNDGPFGKVATCSQKVGELWLSEGFDVTPLYRKPTIAEV